MPSSDTLPLLLEIGRLLSSKLDLAELLRTVLELAARVVDAESGSLLLLDERTQELYFDVALGLGEKAAQVRLKLGQGVAGSVAAGREPAVINDARKDPRWSGDVDAASGFVTRSILAVPVTVHGRLIGVVEAINKKSGDFTPEDARTFEAFASQAGVAIENARLFSSLKQEKTKLDTVFSEMSDGALLCDARGGVVLANEAARRYLGGAATIAAALEGFATTPSLLEMMGGAEASYRFAAVREQPKALVLSGRVARIRLDAAIGATREAASGWLCVFRDDTEEWKKEKLKRGFLSLISHKLKTPLASVIGFSEILVEEFRSAPPSGMAAKAAKTINEQGRKLGDLVDKLLRYTTLENPDKTAELGPQPVDELVGAAVAELKGYLGERKATVLIEPAGPRAVVVGDREQLVEVFKNLLENAAKFDPSPAEKKISVWTESSDAGFTIHVKDSGPGIPPEDQQRIFSQFHQIETFFTGQVDGWGLGMPYVKKVVENHGGKVELQSRLGHGTTVSVRLPRRLGAPAPA